MLDNFAQALRWNLDRYPDSPIKDELEDLQLHMKRLRRKLVKWFDENGSQDPPQAS